MAFFLIIIDVRFDLSCFSFFIILIKSILMQENQLLSQISTSITPRTIRGVLVMTQKLMSFKNRIDINIYMLKIIHN